MVWSRMASMKNGFFLTAVLSVLVGVTETVSPARPALAAGAESAASTQFDTINLLVGFRPGAAYDLYARLSARYMLRHLPGHPAFVVENKPEDAQETARRIYRAKPDGATLAALIPAPSQLKTFRDAYDKAMKDPTLRAEAKQQPLEINPTTGQELEVLAKDVLAQPKELVARMNKLMGK